MTLLPLAGQPAPSLYEQAASLLQRGETARAIELLEPALRQNPRDLKALTLMGMALSAAGRLDAAGQQFRQALEINPGFTPALKNLAVNEMAQGEVTKARLHFEQLLAVSPTDPVAHLALAEMAFGAKDYLAAASHFDSSGGLYARDPRTVLEFAQTCAATRQEAKAVDLLSRVSKEAGPDIHFQAGMLLATLGEFRPAAREFEAARNGYPDPYEAGYNLTLAYFKSGDSLEAIRTGEDLIARGFRKPELYNLLAQAYESGGRTKQAYDSLRTATQIDPADQTSYIDLVALCLNHKNYGLALEIANIGMAHVPASERLLVERGIVFAMTDRAEDARKDFEAALKVAPEKGLPHVALGLMLMQNDRTDEAIAVLRRRVRAAASDYIALWFLAEALNRSGVEPATPEMKEAIDAAERSVRINPEVAQSQMLLGKLLARAGQLDAAAAHLERAVRLEPDNVSAMYQLAQVYRRSGQVQRAQELFAKVGKAKAEDREQFANRGVAQILREGAR